MKFSIFTEESVKESIKNDIEYPEIFNGEATSLHTRGNKIKWVSYCITGMIQICLEELCTIDKIDSDGTIWLTLPKEKKG